jgi:hypothetical protein
MDLPQVIVFHSGLVLVSVIGQIACDVGEPDCKLIRPFEIIYNDLGFTLRPWLSEYTIQDYRMVHSDKILTLIPPRDEITLKYRSLIESYNH